MTEPHHRETHCECGRKPAPGELVTIDLSYEPEIGADVQAISQCDGCKDNPEED